MTSDEVRLPQAVGRAAMSNAALVPAQALLSLAASAIVARALGTSLFGTFAVFNALRASLLFYTDVGMSTAASKFIPEVVAREGRAGAIRVIALQAGISLGAGAILIAALLLAAPWIRSLLSVAPEHAFVMPYAAAALAIEECGRVAYIFLWGRFAHHRVNVANLLGTAALPVGVLAAIQAGGSLRAVLFASVVAAAVRTLLLWIAGWLELKKIPVVVVADRVPHLVGRFIRLGAISWVDKLSGYLYGPAFLTLVLATFLEKEAVGQFALALEFTVRVLSFVLSPTHGIILPAVSSVFVAGSSTQRQRAFTAALRTLGLWLAPAAVLLLATAPYVIPGVYSSQYLRAVALTQILTVFYFAEYAIYAPANAVLLAGERLRAYGRVKLISIALLPLFVISTRSLPLEGIAILYGLMRLGVAALLLIAATRVQQLDLPAGFYTRVLSAAIVASAAGLITAVMFGSALVAILPTAAVALTSTLVAYRLFGCFGPEERATLERLNVPGAQRVLRFFHV